MTLTADRRAELIGGCPLFRGLGPADLTAVAAAAIEVEFPADRVIARQGEIGTGFFIVVDGRVKVVRERRDRRAPRSGRVLRGAVGAGRRAARGAGRGGGADHLPRDRVVGLRAGAARRAGGGPRRPPRRRRPAPRGDHGPPDLTGSVVTAAERSSSPPSLPTGTVTFLFTDIEGSTRLVAELGDAAWGELLAAEGRLDRATRRSPRAASRSAPRATRTSSPSRRAGAGDPRGGRGAAGARRPRRGRATPSASGWASTPARRSSSPGDYVGHRGPPRRADRRRRRTAGRSSSPTRPAVLAGDRRRRRHVPRPRRAPAQGPAPAGARLPGRGAPASSATSRRCGRSTRRPTTCRQQLTSFVGRDGGRRRGRPLLARTRLLTLTGPGGTGKTRLSLAVAAEVIGPLSRAASWFVPLAAVTDPELVASSIATAVGLLAPTRTPLAARHRALRGTARRCSSSTTSSRSWRARRSSAEILRGAAEAADDRVQPGAAPDRRASRSSPVPPLARPGRRRRPTCDAIGGRGGRAAVRRARAWPSARGSR